MERTGEASAGRVVHFAMKHATHEKSSATPGMEIVFLTGTIGADEPPGVGDFDYSDPCFSACEQWSQRDRQ